uniref:Uncharacterized protein n=1 Tax=Rhizophora mucronata TaxID=61149 RepID=A0A2P2J936_RHIMU
MGLWQLEKFINRFELTKLLNWQWLQGRESCGSNYVKNFRQDNPYGKKMNLKVIKY